MCPSHKGGGSGVCQGGARVQTRESVKPPATFPASAQGSDLLENEPRLSMAYMASQGYCIVPRGEQHYVGGLSCPPPQKNLLPKGQASHRGGDGNWSKLVDDSTVTTWRYQALCPSSEYRLQYAVVGQPTSGQTQRVGSLTSPQ